MHASRSPQIDLGMSISARSSCTRLVIFSTMLEDGDATVYVCMRMMAILIAMRKLPILCIVFPIVVITIYGNSHSHRFAVVLLLMHTSPTPTMLTLMTCDSPKKKIFAWGNGIGMRYPSPRPRYRINMVNHTQTWTSNMKVSAKVCAALARRICMFVCVIVPKIPEPCAFARAAPCLA